MHPAQRAVAADKPQTLHEVVGQRLGQRRLKTLHERAGEVLYGARREPRLAHALGDAVVRLHRHAREHHVLRLIDVGMCEVGTPVEGRRLAEDDVVVMELERLEQIAGAVEPHAVHPAVAVGEVRHETLLASRTYGLHADELTPQLHIRHLGENLRGAVEPRAVDVAVREIEQQVLPGGEAQLLLQHLGTLRPDAGEIL